MIETSAASRARHRYYSRGHLMSRSVADKKRTALRGLLFLLLAFDGTASWACRLPPARQLGASVTDVSVATVSPGRTDSSRVTDSTEHAVATGDVDYERIGRFIYAFHRSGVSREELTSIEVAHVPPELAERAQQLADEFDLILKSNARVPDEHINAVLRQARELRVALEAWRKSLRPG